MSDPLSDAVLSQATALLRRRQAPQWVSFSWVALRPLISSVNQELAVGAPALVPDLRDYWLTQVPPTGTTLAEERIVDRRGDSSFVVMGDPGEQDESQYIVAPVLRRVVADRRPGFGVICSDVIYPSGSVNDYVHGLYLPYGPTPPESGDVAAGEPLARLPILGLPGNHDWHDGLSGFMQHFCGTGPLDTAELGWPATPAAGWPGLREGLVRMIWRRPLHPTPQVLWKGPAGSPNTDPLTVEQLRRLRAPDGEHPTTQPGPYHAVRTRDLLVVCIDAGMGLAGGDSYLDPVQARWFLEVSRLPGAKVLLTGNPLLVNGQWKICWLGAVPEGSTRQAPFGDSGLTTVNDVVADPRFGYVAAIGGDVHNYQHYRPEVGPPQARRRLDYVVSGGGGAYMSATHPVPVARALIAEQVRAATGAPHGADGTGVGTGADTGPDDTAAMDPTPGAARLGPEPLRMAPTPVESLVHYTGLMLPKLWRLERALLTIVAGVAVGAGVASTDATHVGRDLAVGLAALTLLVLARVALPPGFDRSSATALRAHRAALVVASGLAGVDAALGTAWAEGPYWRRYLAGWALLTGAGALIAWQLRRTGWWRDPLPKEPPLDDTRRWQAAAAGAALLIAGIAFGLPLPGAARWVPVGTASAVIVAAVVGWRLRPSTPTADGSWNTRGPIVGYAVQGVAAFVVLSWASFADRPWLPAAVLVCGVVGTAAVVLVAFGLAAATLRTICTLRPGPWQRQWGRLGYLTPALVGVFVLIWLVVGLTLDHTWAPGAGDVGRGPAVLRVALGTQFGIITPLFVVLAVDTFRRHARGWLYKVASLALVAVLAALTWIVDGAGHWPVRAAIVAAAVGLLVVVTVSLVHLVFLGGHRLVVDLPAHQDGRALLTSEQAADFFAWRGGRADPLPPIAHYRARMVAPSSAQPRGPIQDKVSEIFDSDDPPFWKNFLLLTTEAGALTIEVFVVHGLGPVAQEATATERLVIPLS